MATEVPTITIYAGDTAIWPTYTFTDESEQPRNLVLEGWGQWQAQWRVKPESDVAINLVVDDSQAQNGVIKLSSGPTNTNLMGANGVWDLQAINGGTVKTWIRGKTKWVKDVTRG